MKYSFEIAIFLAICSIVYTLATTNIISNQGPNSGVVATFTEEKLAQLENFLMDLSTRVQDLEQKNENLERNNNEMSSRIEDLENENKKMSPGMLEPPRYLDYSPVRLVLYRLVTSKYFDLAISAVIGLNIITMAMEFYMMPQVGKL